MGVKLTEAYKTGRRIVKTVGLPRTHSVACGNGKSIYLENLDGSLSWLKAERLKQRAASWAKMPELAPEDLKFILDDRTNLHFIPMFSGQPTVTAHPSGTSYEYLTAPEQEAAEKWEILELLTKECDRLGLVNRIIDQHLYVQVV